MTKKPLAVFFVTAFSWLPLYAADLAKPSQGVEPAKLLSREEYDEQAKLRINTFNLPEGVTAELFADGSQTQNPTAICFDEKGRLYIAEVHRWRHGVEDIRNEQRLLLQDMAIQSSADRLAMYQSDALSRPVSFYTEYSDRIVVLEDSDKDGRADYSQAWADDFDEILDGPGIGLMSDGAGSILYTNIPHLWKLSDSNGDGKADKRESLQDGFGIRMSISGHDMHGLAMGPDGRIYWSIGDRGSSITTKEGRHYHRPTEGSVFRCEPDGSNLEEVYRGLRNPQELAFDKYGNLFTCDNNADAGDKGRLVYLMEGGDSGWSFGHQALLNFRDQLNLRTPDFQHPGLAKIPLNRWMTEGIWDLNHPERPAYCLPPIDHVSWGPSGMVYNYGATALPEKYADHFWVCNFGGAKADLEAFTVAPSGAGFQVSHKEIFMGGVGNTDVEFGPDGKMYLSCFNNNGWMKQDTGNVYTIFEEKAATSPKVKDTFELLTGDFSSFDSKKLGSLLLHPDMRVRQKAQFALVRKNDSSALISATKQENQIARLHGVWGLGQLGRKGGPLDEIVSLLGDADAEVRAQAVKVLADSRNPEFGEALTSLLDDESARVKGFAAIGVGKCSHPQAIPKLLEVLAENDNQDPFLRHGCVQGLWYLNEREKILKQVKHESAAVRLGVLLTLRKLLDPRASYFLADEDKFVRDEAVRAIHDLDLVTALPALAESISSYTKEDDKKMLPKDHRDWMIQLRLVNANFRLGGEEQAKHLVHYAANSHLPEILREQALKALLEWKSPTPADPVTGLLREIDPASRADISSQIKEALPAVFTNVSGELLSVATDLAMEYEVLVPEELLVSQIKNTDANLNARLGSIKGLASQNPKKLEPLWEELFSSQSPEIRSQAVESLLQIDSKAGVEKALSFARSENLRDRQSAYRLLATSESPEAVELFTQKLKDIENEPNGSLLDLVEAAEQRTEEGIQKLLADYQAGIDASNLMEVYQGSLAGGNVESGRNLFMTHAAGQCAKCHKVEKAGGAAGPDLTLIGKRSDSRYILESLIDPSAVVVPGYGLTMLSLKNGETLGGTLMKEDKSSLTLKLPDPENPEKQVQREINLDEIATRQPPISAMPPMVGLVSKSELRDMVAYLASLKGGKKEKKGH